jgi:diphosphomevalonate decarboxylase
MQTSAATSTLLQHRATQVVPQRMKDMEEAIRSQDFQKFAELTMKESNQFHAVCLDTYPPICYLNDISKSIMQLVTDYNQSVGEVRCAYTFDAGPNAVLYVQSQHLLQVAAVVARAFGSRLFEGTTLQTEVETYSDNDSLSKVSFLGGVKRVYLTKVGPGPQVLRDVCNLDPRTGLNAYTPPPKPT